MTQSEALYKFFSGFGIPAFPTHLVPEEVKLPYLTYELKTGFWGDSVSSAIHLYYYTQSEKLPNGKAQEIGEEIGLGGIHIPYDGGTMWIKRGEPWCISLDGDKPALKHRQLMTIIEFN